MDGRDRNAGAVTGVTATRNPISLARAVMEHSPHVFLSREGADQFSREQGLRAGAARLFRDRGAPPPARGIARPPRGRAFRRPSEIRHGRRGRARPAAAMSPPPPRPAASPASAGAGSAIRRSSAPAPMPTTAAARSRRPAPANISSASASPTRSARGCGSAGDGAQAAADAVMAEVAALGGSGGVIVVDARRRGRRSASTRPECIAARPRPAGRSVAIYGDEDAHDPPPRSSLLLLAPRAGARPSPGGNMAMRRWRRSPS